MLVTPTFIYAARLLPWSLDICSTASSTFPVGHLKCIIKPKTFKLSYPKTYSTVLISESYSSILSLVQANKHFVVILDSFLTPYHIYWPMPLALPSNITESKAFPLPSLLLSHYHLLPKLFLLSLSLPAPTPPPTHPPPSN